MANQELHTIQGYIRALPWLGVKKDEKVRVALVSEDGTEYQILHKGVGMELTGHINANARLSGILQKEDDIYIMIVKQFDLTDGFEDAWYDDELD